MPSLRRDEMLIENPKVYFQSKKKILRFAEGLDCDIKFSDSNKKSKLLIISNVFQSERDRRNPASVEQDRMFRVHQIKEKILDIMKDSADLNKSSFINLMDEETRANCKVKSSQTSAPFVDVTSNNGTGCSVDTTSASSASEVLFWSPESSRSTNVQLLTAKTLKESFS